MSPPPDSVGGRKNGKERGEGRIVEIKQHALTMTTTTL